MGTVFRIFAALLFASVLSVSANAGYVGNDPLNHTDPTGKCMVAGMAPGASFCMPTEGLTFQEHASTIAEAQIKGTVTGVAIAGSVVVPDPTDVVIAATIARAAGVIGKGNRVADGLGDLTRSEVDQIQGVVDEAGRPLEVVGSAARGERRGVGTDLPVGKGPGTRSDIDYTTANSNMDNFDGIADQLPGRGDHGILRGSTDPSQGPGIRFEPGQKPTCIPGNGGTC